MVFFPPLVPEGLGHTLSRGPSSIYLFFGSPSGARAHAAILQIAVAVFVDQNPAFAAALVIRIRIPAGRSGDTEPEFHVAQRHAMAQGHPIPSPVTMPPLVL